ncbi:MAG: hypothetical protein ACHQF3_16465 [Alphaproteobacteria bacterium]
MDKKDPSKPVDTSVPSDAEVADAAERLSVSWARTTARPRSAGPGQILQSLAHGRSHVVALEIKRTTRPRGGSR